MNGVLKITKSNKLLNAKDKVALNSLEQKIFMHCIINSDKENVETEKSININDLYDADKLNGKSYIAFRRAVKNLVTSAVSFEEFEEGEWIRGKYIPLFKMIDVDKNTGFCKFKMNGELSQEISHLSHNFTTYNYEQVKHLASGFSIRIYELLMQGKNKYRSREFEVEKFLEVLSVEKVKSYQTFSKIREKILDPCCKEISQKTDIDCSWEVTQKHGQKITKFMFLWRFKNTVEVAPEENQRDENISSPELTPLTQNQQSLIPYQTTIKPSIEAPLVQDDKQKRLLERLCQFGFDTTTATKICTVTQASKESGVWKILYDVNILCNDGKIENPQGYLMRIFKEHKWV